MDTKEFEKLIEYTKAKEDTGFSFSDLGDMIIELQKAEPNFEQIIDFECVFKILCNREWKLENGKASQCTEIEKKLGQGINQKIRAQITQFFAETGLLKEGSMPFPEYNCEINLFKDMIIEYRKWLRAKLEYEYEHTTTM